jgi:hypothetical protein
MSTDQDEALVRELAEPLVAQFSPAEQGELFDVLSLAHFEDPEAFTRQDPDRGPLAFGLPELSVLLTPVFLAAMHEAVRYVVAAAMAKGAKVTVTAIRRLFRRGPAPGPGTVPGTAPGTEPGAEPALELTPEQWSEVRRIVERVALMGGVPTDQAHLMADAVVGQGRSGRDGS